MGDRHFWSITTRKEASQIFACHYRLFYEMDRGKTFGSNNRGQDTEFCLEEHRL